MKICIIGFPRSRSSILLETISLYYNIPILGEDINQLTDDHSITPSSREYTELLEKYESVSTGVIRFHPFHQILERPRHLINSNFDLFKFEQYDKIYFTFRESVSDIIASEIVANRLNKFTYKSENELNPDFKISLIDDDIKFVRSYVYAEKIVVKLQEYLKNNNLNFTDLYYNEIPDYLKTNFPNTDTFHVKTNYDYRSIISDYDKIITLYTAYKNEHQ